MNSLAKALAALRRDEMRKQAQVEGEGGTTFPNELVEREQVPMPDLEQQITDKGYPLTDDLPPYPDHGRPEFDVTEPPPRRRR